MRKLSRELTQPARLLGARYLVGPEVVKSPLRLASGQTFGPRPQMGEQRVDPILRIDLGRRRTATPFPVRPMAPVGIRWGMEE
jgi:hypothetical protein